MINHKKFRKYSRQSQKLIFMLIQSYSNFQLGKDPGCKVSEYQTYKSKKELKKLYLKHSEVNISNLKPFDKLKDKLKAKILDTLKMEITDSNKVEIIYNDIENVLREEFQLLVLTLDGTFSLSLNLMSQKSANKFIDWMFEFMLDNNIPFRNEVVELIKEGDERKYIYTMLIKKICVICGDKVTGFHHHDRIGSLTYKYDKGTDHRIIPLCPKCHSYVESGIDEEKFYKEHHLNGGILLNKDEALKVKKIYPHHFKNLKEGDLY